MPISCGIHLSGAKQPKSPVARRSPSKRPATGGELGATLATLMLASGINIGQRPTPTRRGMVIPYVPNHRWDRTWTFCLTSSEDDAANTVLPGFYEDFHGETDHSMEYIEMSPPQSSHGHSLASMGVKHTHTHKYQVTIIDIQVCRQMCSHCLPCASLVPTAFPLLPKTGSKGPIKITQSHTSPDLSVGFAISSIHL